MNKRPIIQEVFICDACTSACHGDIKFDDLTVEFWHPTDGELLDTEGVSASHQLECMLYLTERYPEIVINYPKEFMLVEDE